MAEFAPGALSIQSSPALTLALTRSAEREAAPPAELVVGSCAKEA